MTQEHEKRLEWAVDVLRETPALPENFLTDFDRKLALEPETASVTDVVVTLHPTRGGATSGQTTHWAAGLAAAVLMLCALFGLIGRPKTDVVAVKPTGLFVVAGAQEAKLNQEPVTAVVELDTESLLETGAESVVLMAGEPGNEVRIGPKSRVGVRVSEAPADSGHRSELQLASGSVFISESESKVSVRTSHALIAPVGTDYRVVKSPSSTEITVLDGRVNVQPPEGGQGISLQPGQRMTVGENTDWSRVQVKRLPESGLAPLQTTRSTLRRLKVRPEVGSSLRTYPKAKKPPTQRPKSRVSEPIGRAAEPPSQARRVPPASTPQARAARVPRARVAVRPKSKKPVAQKRARVRRQARAASIGDVKYPVRPRVKRPRTSPNITTAPAARVQRAKLQRPNRPAQRSEWRKRNPRVRVGQRASQTQVNRRRQAKTQFRKGQDATRSRVNQGAGRARGNLNPSSSRRVRHGGRRR